MNFRQGLSEDAPEINLIPLIDVLLVVLIFLAASTSFIHTAQLQLSLPQAQIEDHAAPTTLTLAISQDGQYALNDQWLPGTELDDVAQALRLAAQGTNDPALVIYADANATHAHVILALQAAQASGIARLSFATERRP